MIPIQPVKLHTYLQWQKNEVPQSLNHYFFMSWEDALWRLLEHFQIESGSVILLPSFYCGDVIENMKAHGLVPAFYRVGEDFQTVPAEFKKQLLAHNPAIVVIFHAVGITNQLFVSTESWLPALKNAFLIEDSVHKVVDPEKIFLVSTRHIVIDSLRKVMPIQGSNLYCDKSIILENKKIFFTLFYQFLVVFWWVVFQLCLLVSLVPVGKHWSTWWNRGAEKAMLRGYDIVGDSLEGAPGWWVFKKLAQHVAIKKIKRTKQEQVNLYQSLLSGKYKSVIKTLPISERDTGELRGYPVLVALAYADSFLAALREKGLVLRYELNDSIWSQTNKVLYLPLGPHLSDREIVSIATAVLNTAENMASEISFSRFSSSENCGIIPLLES